MKYSIGRDVEANIRIAEDSISRIHCFLQEENPGFLLLIDNNSTNKVFVNGLPIDSAFIFPNDKILLGEYPVSYQRLRMELEIYKNHDITDFSSHFIALQVLYDDYQKKLQRVDRNRHLIVNSINILLVLAMLAINVIVFNDNEKADKIIQALSSAFLLILVMVFHGKEGFWERQRDKVHKAFRAEYRCPRCKSTLLIEDYTSTFVGNNCNKCTLNFT